MERKKYIIIILLLFINTFSYSTSNYQSDIYHSYVNNDMKKWKSIIDEMTSKKIENNEFILELLNYQYGYIAWSIGNNKKDEAKKYLDLAYKNLKILEKNNYKISHIYTYKSAFIGFEIALNFYKAPFIGPKSISFVEDAIKHDKFNPMVYIQYGNIQYYLPEYLGGSKTEAIEYYKKAQTIMENYIFHNKKNWNYLNLLINIAKAYTELNDYKMAKEYYEKILEIEPNFLWVKKELYPEILKKHKYE